MADQPSVAEIESALVAEIASILSCNAAAVARDVPFHQLGMDSLAFVSLLVFIEQRYGLKLINSALGAEAFASVSTLAIAIREML